MRCFTVLLVVTLLSCLPHSQAVGQRVSNQVQEEQARQFITHLYQEYYLRFPNPSEVEVWMQDVRKGNSLDEIHAAFLGSDEYYARMGRNDSNWFNGMYLTVANRQPTTDVIYYWSNRLRQLNGDRRRLAREFLRSQMAGSNSGANYDPGFGQLPNQPSTLGLPSQLVTSSQQLAQSVRSEFSGWNRTLLQLQANNLSNLAQQSQTTLQNATLDPLAANSALQRLNSAVQGLNSQFQSTAGGTSSRMYLDQINRAIRALNDSLSSGGGIGAIGGPTFPSYPTFYPPVQEETLSRQDARSIARIANRLLDKMRQTYSVVQDLSRYDYRYSALVNDLGQLTFEMQNFSNGIYEGMPKSRLRQQTESIRGRLQNIGGRLQNQSIDIRLSQAWFATIQEFDKFWTEIGGLDTSYPGAGGNLDWTRIQALQRPTDQALSYCDLLLFQYGSYYYYGNQYSKFVDELRSLRNSLSDFRSNLNYNSTNAAIQTKLREVNNVYRSVELSWNDLMRQTGMAGGNGLYNLSNAIRELTTVASSR
jgi:hypothetical protein